MYKILEKIYTEKDSGTNISIFIGSMVALIVYLTSNDVAITAISFMGIFSLSKVVSKFISNLFINKINKQNILNNYSKIEMEVINTYIKKGVCFITMSEYKNGILNTEGLDSLVSRGLIQFEDNSMMAGPSGFKLNEDVYKNLISK